MSWKFPFIKMKYFAVIMSWKLNEIIKITTQHAFIFNLILLPNKKVDSLAILWSPQIIEKKKIQFQQLPKIRNLSTSYKFITFIQFQQFTFWNSESHYLQTLSNDLNRRKILPIQGLQKSQNCCTKTCSIFWHSLTNFQQLPIAHNVLEILFCLLVKCRRK